MAETELTKTSDILQQAINEAQIMSHFQYGHDLLQSPVQIDEIFSILDTIIKKVLEQIEDIIPEINLAPYKEGYVDSSRANLCWIELQNGYYGLILNTHKGIKYRKFDDDDMSDLILNGQVSSWYLISKIQNLSYMLASNDASTTINKYFEKLIIDIIERFFKDHETSEIYHPAGSVTPRNLESIFIRTQIQNTSSIIPAMDAEKSSDQAWSTSQIKTNIDGKTKTISWQSVSNLSMSQIDSSLVGKIISSSYLNSRADVEALMQETHEKYNGSTKMPNTFCFLSIAKFAHIYENLDYIVECQLHGYIEIVFTNGDKKKLYPDTQPIVLVKGKNSIAILTVIKLDQDITKKIDSIEMKGMTSLPNLFLTCSFTGVSE